MDVNLKSKDDKQGFVKKKELTIKYYDDPNLILPFVWIAMCLLSLFGVLTVLFKKNPENFFRRNQSKVIVAGLVGTIGVVSIFMIPFLILFNKYFETYKSIERLS